MTLAKTLVVGVVMFLALAARADDAASVARKHFDSGQQLSARGLYLEALAEFSAGFELSGKPLFLFNMAECARSAGQKDRARQLYQRYLASDSTGKLAAVARSRLEDLEAGAPPPPAPPPPVAAPPPPAPPAEAPTVAAPLPDKPAEPILVEKHRPLWKNKGLWIGVGVGAAVLIVAGVVGGYYGTHGADSCSGACVSFR